MYMRSVWLMKYHNIEAMASLLAGIAYFYPDVSTNVWQHDCIYSK